MKHLLSTKAMNRPVRPPIRPRALPTLFAAPLRAGPAEEVTLERPSEAFDWNFEAVSEAFEAASFAASVALAVVDSNRRDVRPVNLADCRSTAREPRSDMVKPLEPSTDSKRFLNCPTVVGQAIGR